MNFFKYYAFVFMFSLPFFTSAAFVSAPRDFKGLVSLLAGIIEKLVILTFALTFLAFAWGVVKNWIIHGDSPENIDGGKKVVMVSVIALVIMVSIWGILSMLKLSLFGGL